MEIIRENVSEDEGLKIEAIATLVEKANMIGLGEEVITSITFIKEEQEGHCVMNVKFGFGNLEATACD